MELTFRKEGSKYIAEFVVAADFNLHLEREDDGFLYVQQRTSTSGQYDSIKGCNFAPKDNVVDYDFAGVVYPKYIKVISEVMPTSAIVTSYGTIVENKRVFNIDGVEYPLLDGMTWGDFVDSEQNADGNFVAHNDYVVHAATVDQFEKWAVFDNAVGDYVHTYDMVRGQSYSYQALYL